MENLLTVSASPHITDKRNSTRGIMRDVAIALTPCLAAAIFFFGFTVLINAIVCVGACFGFELLYNLIISKKWNGEGVREASVWDFSFLVTGLILALNLPSVIRVSGWDLNLYSTSSGLSFRTGGEPESIVMSFDAIIMCVIGSLAAIVLVKMLFGGIGKNFANPAAVGRIVIFVIAGLGAVNTVGLGLNATTGATWLTGAGGVPRPSVNGNQLLEMFLGIKGSSAAGETCIIASLLGLIYLSVRRVIDFRIPLMVIGSAALFALVFDGLIVKQLVGKDLIFNMLAHVLSGGLVFGAVFMATDYATSPNTFLGNVIFCCGIGLLTVLIRVFGSWPEGMSFALVIMNLVTPLIDKFVYPRPFGYVKKKKAGKEAAPPEPAVSSSGEGAK